MGSVYLALDLKLDVKVALKIPVPRSLPTPRLKQHSIAKPVRAARLVHPGLCWVMDVGQVEDTHYIVMRYVPGTPLSKMSELRAGRSRSDGSGVALAMAAAHREGVVHRDLKPSNIIVTPEGNPVVVDFGLALLLEEDLTRLTGPGELLGTPHYMAPEQFLGILEEEWFALRHLLVGLCALQAAHGAAPGSRLRSIDYFGTSRPIHRFRPRSTIPRHRPGTGFHLPESYRPTCPRTLPEHGGVCRLLGRLHRGASRTADGIGCKPQTPFVVGEDMPPSIAKRSASFSRLRTRLPQGWNGARPFVPGRR